MSAPAIRSTDEVMADVLSDLPDVLATLRDAWHAAWAAVDPVLLESCRLLVASILGCDAELAARTPLARAAGFRDEHASAMANWHASTLFGPRERACFAFTEQFVIDVANLDDATAGDVRSHLGDVGLASFVSALLVVEQRQRLRLMWAHVMVAAA